MEVQVWWGRDRVAGVADVAEHCPGLDELAGLIEADVPESEDEAG